MPFFVFVVEATKKILAYQQSPFIVTAEQSAVLPDDFLISLTAEEQEYVLTRSNSVVEPMFYELLPRVGAAGLLSVAPRLLIDVHLIKPRLFMSVDGIGLPLAEDGSTQEFLVRQYAEPYRDELSRLVAKTEQRFGSAHVVHLSCLPQFLNGKFVSHDLVTFGVPSLPGAVHEPDELRGFYEGLLVSGFPAHTWIGINKKLFMTHTLRQELVGRLSRLRTEAVARSSWYAT